MVNGNLVYTAVVPELQLAASRVCINDNISHPLNKNPQVCEFSFSVRLHSVVEEDVWELSFQSIFIIPVGNKAGNLHGCKSNNTTMIYTLR